MGVIINSAAAASGIAFVAASPEEVELTDAPINPEWIVSGRPRARSGLHSTNLAKDTSTNIWDCTAGSFWWTFYNEETVVILEGAVRVTTADGIERTLGVGDIAYFARDSRALWEIDDYVRKIAFCSHPASSQVRALRSVLSKMKRNVTKRRWSTPFIGTLAAILPL